MVRSLAALAVGLLVAASIGVIGWKVKQALRSPPSKTVVQRPGPTTVLVTPQLTPLQARRAKRTAAARSPDSRASSSPRAPSASTPTPSRRTRVPAAKRKSPTTRPDRRPTSQPPKPPAATQPSTSPPQTTTPRPPADVQLPVPGTVCIKPVGGLNCP